MRRPLLLLLSMGIVTAGCTSGEVATPSTTYSDPAPDDAALACAVSQNAEDASASASPTPAATITIAAADEPPLPHLPASCPMTEARIEKTIAAIMAAPAPTGPALARAPWDHKTPPANLDLVKKRLGLTEAESAVLEREGFVVPSRLEFPTYSPAYHEIYQSQLPLYVTADSIFHSIYVTHDEMVENLELSRLAPLTDKTLAAMHRALPKAEYPDATAHDLDLYLTVARSLLAGILVKSAHGTDAEAAAIVRSVMRADALAEVRMFGRSRMIDFSQYKPRGHYTHSVALGRYFRATMWLSRLELNVVSRSSRSSEPGITPNPEETPHEAVDALALADLADRSGALPDVEKLDHAWSLLAGVREDVSLADLSKIEKKLQITTISDDAFPALKSEIGDKWKRTARLHYMPEGSTELPAITTMIGPRVVFDSMATRPLVHSEVAQRFDLDVADIAYMLGHDRAKTYLAHDLAVFPELNAQLEKARAIASAPIGGNDLYGAWFGAIRSLSEKPIGVTPSFMANDSFKDLRINSTVAAYGQLKHDHVLIAGQPYDEGACQIPDGFVEPVPATWTWLETYAQRGEAAMRELDPRDATGNTAYFQRVQKIVRVLKAISLEELAGHPLSADALTFLSMVVEIHAVDIGTGWDTTFNGWYFDLFSKRPSQTTAATGHDSDPSFKTASFIGDFYTSVNTGNVAYAGARGPRLGVFVIDTGGQPRVVVGPVAHAYEYRGPLTARVTDAQSMTLGSGAMLGAITEPWSASYTVSPSAPPPPLAIKIDFAEDSPDEIGAQRTPHMIATVRSSRRLGNVSIDLLDHHRVLVATLTKEVSTLDVAFDFKSKPAVVLPGTHGVEMVRVRVGDFSRDVWMIDRAWEPIGIGGMHAPTR